MVIFNESGAVVNSMYVCSILPRANAEAEYQEKVRQNNLEIAKMVKDVRKFIISTIKW